MLDLNTYLLYGLFMSGFKAQAESDNSSRGKARAVRFSFVAWTLASLGATLMKSGRKLKERYEPLVRTYPQTSN